MVILRYFFAVFVSFFFAWSQACAVDLNNDGKDEVFIYRKDLQAVQAYTARGSFVTQVPVSDLLVGSPPIFFPGKSGGQAVIYTLLVTGTNQSGTLYRLEANGKSQAKSLDTVKDFAFLIYDIDNDDETDIVKVNKAGEVIVILRPYTASEEFINFNINKLKRYSKVTLTSINNQPYVAVYTAARKQRKTTFHLYPILSGTKQRRSIRKKLKKQLYPHVINGGLAPGQFSTFKLNKNGVVKKFQFVDLQTSRVRRISINPSTALVPGFYESGGSDLQLFSVSGTGKVIDIGSNGAALSELNLSSLSGPINATPTPTPGLPTPTPTPGLPTPTPFPTPTFGCNNVYPTTLLAQIEAAYQQGDTTQVQILLNQLNNERWCSTTWQQILEELDRIIKRYRNRSTRLFKISQRNETTFVVPPPLLSLISSANSGSGNNNQGGGSSGGGASQNLSCDNVQDGSDGPGGFLLKASDHGGDLVILLPAAFSTQKTELVRPNGKVIEKLSYSGRSNADANGLRETWRGSKAPTSYPKKLYVRTYVKPVGVDTAIVECFKIDNSHIRND